MSFAVSRIVEQGMDLVRLYDPATKIEVKILPRLGALLHAFIIPLDGVSFNVIDHYVSREQALAEIGNSYKSAKLSPFVCRIAKGKYRFAHQSFEFANKFQDGSAIHGLLFDKPFSVVRETASKEGAEVSLHYTYRRDDPQFPFEYRSEVVYRLLPKGYLELETKIINLSAGEIPMADGWHPYFQLGGKVNEWLLSFQAENLVEFDEELIPTGRILPYEQFQMLTQVEDKFFDNCFILKPQKRVPACELVNPENGLTLRFWPGSGYPYLQIYTPQHRKSIAIENLSSAPDAFNNQMGLTILASQKSQTFTLRYQLCLG